MNEADDKLLKQFFSDNKKEIADRGFSERVMQHLPSRAGKIASILASVCMVLSVILFFVFDGFYALLGALRDAFVAIMQHSAMNIDLRGLAIAGVVLLIYGVRKIYTME